MEAIKSELLWHIQDGLDQQEGAAAHAHHSLRHGQAEHNLEGAAILTEENPDRKPDNLSELTEPPSRRSNLVPLFAICSATAVAFAVSPFERTLQTLYSLQRALGNASAQGMSILAFASKSSATSRRRTRCKHSQSQEVGGSTIDAPRASADVYDRASNLEFRAALTPRRRSAQPSHAA